MKCQSFDTLLNKFYLMYTVFFNKYKWTCTIRLHNYKCIIYLKFGIYAY